MTYKEAANILASFVLYELNAGLITELEDDEFAELEEAVSTVIEGEE